MQFFNHVPISNEAKQAATAGSAWKGVALALESISVVMTMLGKESTPRPSQLLQAVWVSKPISWSLCALQQKSLLKVIIEKKQASGSFELALIPA